MSTGAVAMRNSVTIFGGVIGTGFDPQPLDESLGSFVSIRAIKNI
jgi:hypothetical protein